MSEASGLFVSAQVWFGVAYLAESGWATWLALGVGVFSYVTYLMVQRWEDELDRHSNYRT